MFFLAICTSYILSACVGLREHVLSEYYFMPLTMLTVLLFDSRERKIMLLGMSFPLVGWVLSRKLNFIDLGPYWIPENFPYQIFCDLNFVGAFGITVIFMWLYNNSINRVKQLALEAERVRLTLETERTRTEQLLEQSSRLSALGQMAAGIGHEINNPVTIILGRANQLIRTIQESKLDPQVASELQTGMGKIISTSQRIAKIVRGLRLLARSGEEDPFDVVIVSQLIDEVLDLCRERFKAASVTIEYAPPPSNYRVIGNASQLGQVLLNLISNSFDAVSELDDKWVRIAVEKTEQEVLISIVDSGLGISDDVLNKMHTPFFTTKEVGKGTGLGISISRNILEHHNGKLLYDKTSKNTKFVVALPEPTWTYEKVRAKQSA
jgi:signal transduction histidine kinase